MKTRSLVALAYAGARIAYGVALVANPRRTARRWLGDGSITAPAGWAPGRSARATPCCRPGWCDALQRGRDPLPWLISLAASDLVDIGATVADRGDLPAHAAPATALVAGAFCICGLALAAAHSDG